MKKLLFALFVISFAVFLFSPRVYADAKEEYKSSFSLVDGEKLYEIIDNNTRDFFKKNNIDVSDYSWINNLTPKNIFSEIFEVLKNGLKKPIKAGITVGLIIVLTAGFSAFDLKGGAFKTVLMLCAFLSSIIMVNDIWGCITATVSAIKYISGFMIAFVPIFIMAVSFSGGTVSGASSGGLILLSANAVSYFANEFVLPIMGGYLSLNLVSSVSPFTSFSEITVAIKKAVIWTLSLIFTVFVGIVGIGTTINSATDSFSLKTAKFILGTCVPIAGGALCDSANTIYASMNILKSSIGIYGVLVVAIAVIPLLIELLVWKGVLSVLKGLSSGLSQNFVTSFLSSLNELLSVLVAILLFSGGIYIITLSIVVSVTKL